MVHKIPMIKKYLFWIILIGLFLLGLGGIRMVSNAIESRALARVTDQSAEIMTAYATRVALVQDVSVLVARGEGLLAKGYADYARLNFRRASDLDPNVRDVAYAWGYSLVTARQGQLTSDDTKELAQAIERTEKVDPFFIPLLELKYDLAQKTNDHATAEATKKRLEILKK